MTCTEKPYSSQAPLEGWGVCLRLLVDVQVRMSSSIMDIHIKKQNLCGMKSPLSDLAPGCSLLTSPTRMKFLN